MTAEVMTAQAPGNTNTGAFKARAYQLTLNRVEKYDELKRLLTKLKSLSYFISCKEKAPTTGHEHIHIYVHFSSTYRLSKKIMAIGAHVEICKGSPKQNIAYIKKDGEILDEIGELPHQGIMSVKELREANVDDVNPHLYRIKKEIDAEKHDEEVFFNMLDEIEKDELKAPKIIYITGGSGKGKTYTAYKTALKEYAKQDIGKLTLNNDFVDIVNEKAKCFVIEEFRPSQMKASNFLQLTDKYGYRCNIKGGFCTLRPECIIICSILPIEDIYRDEHNKQFKRRVTSVVNLGHDDTVLDELYS